MEEIAKWVKLAQNRVQWSDVGGYGHELKGSVKG
jgi:hypothetical protein